MFPINQGILARLDAHDEAAWDNELLNAIDRHCIARVEQATAAEMGKVLDAILQAPPPFGDEEEPERWDGQS